MAAQLGGLFCACMYHRQTRLYGLCPAHASLTRTLFPARRPVTKLCPPMNRRRAFVGKQMARNGACNLLCWCAHFFSCALPFGEKNRSGCRLKCCVLNTSLKKGSSRFPGEGCLDFQEEVVRVPEAIGHTLDHLDTVVHALQQAGMHRETGTGENAADIASEVFGEAL